MRVYLGRFSVDYKKFQDMKDALAQDNQKHEVFMKYVHWTIGEYTKKGLDPQKYCRLTYPSPQTLHQLEIISVEYELPPERFMEVPAYMQLHGAPPSVLDVCGGGGTILRPLLPTLPHLLFLFPSATVEWVCGSAWVGVRGWLGR